MIPKIMLIIPTLDFGGAERVMMTLADHLDKQRFAIYFIILNKQGVFSTYANPKVIIMDLKARHVRHSIFRLLKLFWEIRPDVVISTLSHLNILLMLLKLFMPKNIVYIARESSIPSMNNKELKHYNIIDILYKMVYSKFDAIVCQSNGIRDDLLNNYHILPDKLLVINNPIDLKQIQEKATQINHKLFDPNKINLLAIGRLSREKGFDLGIRVLGLLNNSNYHLTILGDGEEKAQLENLSKELGVEDQITFAGFQPNPFAYMQQANLLILSSRFEGFPNVVLEANACGLPVVAFNCPGGIQEIIIDDSSGCLVENGNIELMAEKIKQYIALPINREVIIDSIRTRFDVSIIVKSYEKLIWTQIKQPSLT